MEELLEASYRIYILLYIWAALWPLPLSSFRLISFGCNMILNQSYNAKLDSTTNIDQWYFYHAGKVTRKDQRLETLSYSSPGGRL